VLSSATVTTLAGSASGVASAANGVGTNAGFSSPNNVVMDSSGTLLFVADGTNKLHWVGSYVSAHGWHWVERNVVVPRRISAPWGGHGSSACPSDLLRVGPGAAVDRW
jgi:hypothetical protein